MGITFFIWVVVGGYYGIKKYLKIIKKVVDTK